MALNVQKVDKHFHLLGLTRGCTEEDLRKAYRQKALVLHPDRNPEGAEAFKEVNAAYENLKIYLERSSAMKNFRTSGMVRPSGGVGPFNVSTSSVASSHSGWNFRQAGVSSPQHHPHTAGQPRPFPGRFPSSKGLYDSPSDEGSASFNGAFSTPEFTDEELFGNKVPGGWSSGAVPMGGSSLPHQGASASAFAEKDEHWRRAHGNRVPVSGYSEHGVVPPPPPSSTAASSPNARNFSQNTGSRGFPSTNSTTSQPHYYGASGSNYNYHHNNISFSNVPNTYDDLKEIIQALYAKTAYVNGSASSDFPRSEKEEMDLLKEKRVQDMWESLRNIRNEEDRRRAVQSGWKRLDEELKEKAESARRRAAEREEDQEREMARQRALAEERRRLQGMEQAARRVREERQMKAKQAAEDLAAALRQEKDEQHQDDLLDDKRRLLKMMFRLQYSPDPADVGDMSDVEVFILHELMSDIAGKVKGVLNARLQKGPCSRCRVAPKMLESAVEKPVFQCCHACVCTACAERASQCPLCSAQRTVPILPVVPNPPPRHNPVSAQGSLPLMGSCSLPEVRSPSGATTGGAGVTMDSAFPSSKSTRVDSLKV